MHTCLLFRRHAYPATARWETARRHHPAYRSSCSPSSFVTLSKHPLPLGFRPSGPPSQLLRAGNLRHPPLPPIFKFPLHFHRGRVLSLDPRSYNLVPLSTDMPVRHACVPWPQYTLVFCFGVTRTPVGPPSQPLGEPSRHHHPVYSSSCLPHFNFFFKPFPLGMRLNQATVPFVSLSFVSTPYFSFSTSTPLGRAPQSCQRPARCERETSAPLRVCFSIKRWLPVSRFGTSSLPSIHLRGRDTTPLHYFFFIFFPLDPYLKPFTSPRAGAPAGPPSHP